MYIDFYAADFKDPSVLSEIKNLCENTSDLGHFCFEGAVASDLFVKI